MRRRQAIEIGGSALIAGLAGCLGQDSNSEQTSSAAEQTSSAAEQTSSAAEQTSSAAEQTSSAAEQTSSAAEQTSSAAEQTSGTVGQSSPGATPDISGTEIHYVTDAVSEGMQNYIAEVNRMFEEETGAIVNMDYVSLTGAIQRVSQLLQAGSPPDLFYSVSSVGSQLVAQGALQPIDDVLDAVTSELGDPRGTTLESDGSSYLVPSHIYASGFQYRDDLLDDPDYTSWEGFLSAMQEIDGMEDPISGNTLRGHFLNQAVNRPTNKVFYAWAKSNNVNFFGRQDGSITAVFDDDPNRSRLIQTLEFLQNLSQYSTPNRDAGFDGMINSLASGNYATVQYSGVRPKNEAGRSSPEIAEHVRLLGQAMPLGPAANEPKTEGGVQGFFTFKNSNTAAAKEYIKWFMSLNQRLANFYFLDSPLQNVTAYPDFYNSDIYQQTISDALEDWPSWTEKDVEHRLQWTEYPVPPVLETNPPNTQYGAISGANILSNMHYEVQTGDLSPEDAVSKWAEEAESVLNS